MVSVEDFREYILKHILTKPKLGVNYIDWHTEESGMCGLTIKICSQVFDITIRHSEYKL